jgi:hypothetical protein
VAETVFPRKTEATLAPKNPFKKRNRERFCLKSTMNGGEKRLTDSSKSNAIE